MLSYFLILFNFLYICNMRLVEFDSSSTNPFQINHRFIRPFVTYSADKNSGEIKENGKLGDFEEHMRVFPSAYMEIGKMNSMAIQILGYIFKEVAEDDDTVILNAKSLMEVFESSSRNTVIRGIKDLLIYGFLAKKTGVDAYWINPNKIFKGARAKWYNRQHENK